ncbi:MAM domain-containing glycosylphosphatidylinositol anchor protein 2-like, partial [Neopelma chrysocephalum]|uniref:MAM domain-containing glycosylphosphatidylinositol anchor protein 2-like n=1 Tax=Neopelma chrysocephalum TaxID=114329 RepID=UPI000FCCE746
CLHLKKKAFYSSCFNWFFAPQKVVGNHSKPLRVVRCCGRHNSRVSIHHPLIFFFFFFFFIALQLIFEGIRGPGIEGDIAIDDVSIVEGECMKSDQPANNLRSGAVGTFSHIRLLPLLLLMSVLSHQR